MILIHDPEVLVKMIIRTVVRKIGVEHAGILLYDRRKDLYILSVSRSLTDFRLPPGFLGLKKNSFLIRFFTEKKWDLWGKRILSLKDLNTVLKSPRLKRDKELFDFFQALKDQMLIYKAVACIPSFFRTRLRDELVGILILGKKKNCSDFTQEELSFLSALASDVAMAVRNAQLFEDLSEQVERHRGLFLSTVFALAQAIEAKDKYTRGHTQRVTEISLKIAQELVKDKRRKLPPDFLENVRIAALLHDIGKIGIPEKILNKKKPLTLKERKIIELHPQIGAEIISPIKELKEVMQAIKGHHERYDGDGYPHKLKSRKIPLISFVIACADAYDAMTSDRPYRKALPPNEALRNIRRERGKQFHPQIVDILLRLASKKLI